jgi:hypothetical protein
MSYVGFEPMIPASERAKTVHSLGSSATVTGRSNVPLANTAQVTWKLEQNPEILFKLV